MKKFGVSIYYSGFVNYDIEAENEDDAIQKGREMKLDPSMLDLQPWEECDTAEEICQAET